MIQAPAIISRTSMAVASGPAGLVLAGPVFEIVFGIAHAQNSNNVRKSKNDDHTCTSKCLLATSCAALKHAAMLSYQQLTTSTSALLSMDIRTWGRRWSLTTPPERRASNIAAGSLRP